MHVSEEIQVGRERVNLSHKGTSCEFYQTQLGIKVTNRLVYVNDSTDE